MDAVADKDMGRLRNENLSQFRGNRACSRSLCMNVSDIMTRRVVSIAPDATIAEAIGLMLKHHISGLPVIDAHGRLAGIVTEGDFLRRPETGTAHRHPRWLDAVFGPAEGAQRYVHSHGTKVGDVMTRKVVTVDEGERLEQVVHLMETHRIKRLPVLSGDKVVGIGSRANMMRALASVHRGSHKGSKDDAAIRDRILAEIERESWSAGADVDVVVRAGLAGIWGTVTDPEQRTALKVLVAGVPGVTTVVDHLRWDGDITPT
jgi:CBS-domain-containing membrane protein